MNIKTIEKKLRKGNLSRVERNQLADSLCHGRRKLPERQPSTILCRLFFDFQCEEDDGVLIFDTVLPALPPKGAPLILPGDESWAVEGFEFYLGKPYVAIVLMQGGETHPEHLHDATEMLRDIMAAVQCPEVSKDE